MTGETVFDAAFADEALMVGEHVVFMELGALRMAAVTEILCPGEIGGCVTGRMLRKLGLIGSNMAFGAAVYIHAST